MTPRRRSTPAGSYTERVESTAIDPGAAPEAALDAPLPPPTDRPARRARRRLAVDLTLLGLVGVVLVAAVAAGVGALYREFYSPSAFVERYLALLGDGRAADALAIPGVSVDSAVLADAGLPEAASDALLRTSALTTLTDARVTGEKSADGITTVTVSYTAGAHAASTSFDVESAGWTGVVPEWRFAESPLATISLVVLGSQTFDVNGFTLDKRQVSPAGADAAPGDPVSMLVFSPGVYRVAVDGALSTSSAVDILADAPMTDVPLEVQTEATETFVAAVQDEVDSFLDACASQQVLNPTGCPFGFTVRNRIVAPPTWSILDYPVVDIVPAGAEWAMRAVEAVAHIEVDVQLLFDGSIVHVSEDVPFSIDADIIVQPDGSASIRVGSGDDGDR